MISKIIPATARIRTIYCSILKKDAKKTPTKNAKDRIKNIFDFDIFVSFLASILFDPALAGSADVDYFCFC